MHEICCKGLVVHPGCHGYPVCVESRLLCVGGLEHWLSGCVIEMCTYSAKHVLPPHYLPAAFSIID